MLVLAGLAYVNHTPAGGMQTFAYVFMTAATATIASGGGHDRAPYNAGDLRMLQRRPRLSHGLGMSVTETVAAGAL